ncbi:MAG: helix-turn-helix transcriptional regulator [Clostridia bacterium]|nr:helix-turn-helix transcriptional regulator [Clostridia bacterium]
MYNLNKFCNIITSLRKERGWTQAYLADKIGISPQSVSKWECGIGYPDVTLFPVIADLFDISIGVLFGEKKSQEENNMNIDLKHERKFAFEPLKNIEIRVGNICRIEVIKGERENSALSIQGDSVFVEYFSVEKENGNLLLSIKNPTGTDTHWISYDRDGYEKDNVVQLYTGSDESDCTVINYLDLSIEKTVMDDHSTFRVYSRG